MIDAASLDRRLEEMRCALVAAPNEVSASLVIPARQGMDNVAKRLALGVDHTVAAFFGGTGSGKSSLFNALTKLDFADVGARRPTTSRAAACTWGDDATALLDFLGVDPHRRIRRESILDGDDENYLDGLVLLDVPDYDSVTTAHALQVDRLVPLADLLVWVVDPQKYADAALHEGYLRGLGARQEDMGGLINQNDTLPAGGTQALIDDVRALLLADGLDKVRVIAVSAKRGDNLDQVRELFRQVSERESNAARTASAELDSIAKRLSVSVAEREATLDEPATADFQEQMSRSAGVGVVADSIATGLRKIFPPSLARPEAPSRVSVAAQASTWLHRNTDYLPQAWVNSVQDAVSDPEGLVTGVTDLVALVPLPRPRKVLLELGWWLGWIAVLAGFGWMFFKNGGVPSYALVAVGVLSAVASYWLRLRRANREAAAYHEAARGRVDQLVNRDMVKPMQAVFARHNRLRAALAVEKTQA